MVEPTLTSVFLRKYRVESVLDESAFPKVYLGRYLPKQLECAIRIFQKQTYYNDDRLFNDLIRRTRLERLLAARLGEHPNILQVYDADYSNDVAILAMEFVALGSLQRFINVTRMDKRFIALPAFGKVALCVASGLKALHQLDVVHRNIKPSNIFLYNNGIAKLGDWGYAQIADEPANNPIAGRGLLHPGTPAYKSPEQEISHEFLSPASDVYSLGLVLFELLTLRHYRTQQPGMDVKQLREDVPDEINQLVASMLIRNPRERTITLDAVISQLEALGYTTTPIAPPEPTQADAVEPEQEETEPQPESSDWLPEVSELEDVPAAIEGTDDTPEYDEDEVLPEETFTAQPEAMAEEEIPSPDPETPKTEMDASPKEDTSPVIVAPSAVVITSADESEPNSAGSEEPPATEIIDETPTEAAANVDDVLLQADDDTQPEDAPVVAESVDEKPEEMPDFAATADDVTEQPSAGVEAKQKNDMPLFFELGDDVTLEDDSVEAVLADAAPDAEEPVATAQLDEPAKTYLTDDEDVPAKDLGDEDAPDSVAGFMEALMGDNEAVVETTPPDTAEAFFAAGKRYAEKDDLDNAIKNFTSALQMKTTDPDYHFQRGRAYRDKQDYDLAIYDIVHAIQLAPQNSEYFNELAGCYTAKGDFDQAISVYNRIIQVEPENAQFYRQRGIAYHYKRDFDNCIKDKTRAIELEPQNDEHYFSRGVSYNWQRKFDLALEDFNQAIQLNPKKADYYRERGAVYYITQDYDRAIKELDQAIQLEPNRAEFYLERGTNFFRKKNYQSAINNYTNAINLAPARADGYYSRGLAYFEAKQYEPALKDFNKSVELAPDRVEFYYSRGLTSLWMGNYKPALADFSQAIEMKPDNPEYHRQLGVVYHNLGNFEQAIEEKSKAIKLNPKNPYYYYSRYDSYRKLPDYDKAQHDLEKAKALGYKEPNTK